MLDKAFCIFFRESPNLIAERKHLAGLSFVILNGLPLSCKLCFEDLPLAFGGKVRARSHGERTSHHSGQAGNENKVAVTNCRSRDAGDDPEDRAKTIVHAVDSIANPACRLRMAFFPGVEETIELFLRLLRRHCRQGASGADEISQGLIVLSFIGDHFLENRDAWFVAER